MDTISAISARIKKTRKVLGLTQKDLAIKIGIKPQSVSSWERELSRPSGKPLNLLAKILNVSEEWILYGEQDTDKKEDNRVRSPCDVVTMIPFFDNIYASAGTGFENMSELDGCEYPIPTRILNRQNNKQDVFCLRVRGDSMIPVLLDRAIIAVNPHNKQIIDGRIYVLRCNTRLRIKVLRETHLGLRVESYNSEYKPEIIPWKDINNNQCENEIIGEVFWFSSEFQ